MFRMLTLLLLIISSFIHADQGITLAKEYQKNSGLQWDWAIESLDTFTFNPNDKVLDVGCGDGKITAMIARRTPQGTVVGIDISKKMIDQATASFDEENLIFMQGTATLIPFVGQFDKITSFCALHWVLDQSKALQAMKQAVKSGGKLLLVLPGKAANNLAAIAENLAHSEKWVDHFPAFKQERVYYTLNEYVDLLHEVNLNILAISESQSVTIYKDKASLINWIRPLVNFTTHLDQMQQEEFVQDIAVQMLKNDPELPDGSIHLRQSKIEVIATK